MDNVRYFDMPPIMEYIVNGNVDGVRNLLDIGIQPDETVSYKKDIGCNIILESKSILSEIAVIFGKVEILMLLKNRGADFATYGKMLMQLSLKCNQTDIFIYLAQEGVILTEYEFFLYAPNCKSFNNIAPIIDRWNFGYEKHGDALRRAVLDNNLQFVSFLIERGADINYSKSDMVFRDNTTPVIEATRNNYTALVKYLVLNGADITIADKHGNRPYTYAVNNKNSELAAYLKALEPHNWHDEQEKKKRLKSYKLPETMIDYLKNGPLRLEFTRNADVKWIELYSYMDLQEIKWKRKKLISIMSGMDKYCDFLLVWYPKEQGICFIDIEHDVFNFLCTWEEFISNPSLYLFKMINYENN